MNMSSSMNMNGVVERRVAIVLEWGYIPHGRAKVDWCLGRTSMSEPAG